MFENVSACTLYNICVCGGCEYVMISLWRITVLKQLCHERIFFSYLFTVVEFIVYKIVSPDGVNHHKI